MKHQLKKMGKLFFKSLGYEISKIQPEAFSDLRYRDFLSCLEVLQAIEHQDYEEYTHFFSFVEKNKKRSYSQNYQDLFVLFTLNEKKRLDFVEFGATDGIIGSNSYLLEKEYEWSGVVAEPNKSYHSILKKNRKCSISKKAVFSTSNLSIEFSQVEHPEMSGINKTIDNSINEVNRYPVLTITLDELLEKSKVKSGFGFLSIDVEGAELEVLKGFTLNQWLPKIVVIEHNFRKESLLPIQDFFIKQGYTQKYPALSKYDCWFVLNQ